MRSDLGKSLLDVFLSLGATSGKTIFIQAGLVQFIEAARKIQSKYLPKLIIDCLLCAIGDQGTIVMPSFTTNCARKGLPFDLKHTPSDAGSLVEYLRKQPRSCRSLHPVNSVVAFGRLAHAFTEEVSLGSYSWDSPFDRMTLEDTVVICMGMPSNLSNSFSHYAETKASLPYVYNKILDYIPVSIDGNPVFKDFYMTVRYLDYDVSPDRSKHDHLMRQSGLMRFAKWCGGLFYAISLADYLNILKPQLKKDPYFLLSHPPVFRGNERPSDGCTYHEVSINKIGDKGINHERI